MTVYVGSISNQRKLPKWQPFKKICQNDYIFDVYILRIELNIRIEQNIYFVDADLIPTRGRLLVALGILVLAHLFEKGLYQSGTDECYQTMQHSSTTGLINMQRHQLQGSSQ